LKEFESRPIISYAIIQGIIMADDTDHSKYSPYPLSKIQADVPLPGDLYIFLNGHYVKYKELGDSFPGSKFDLFLAKGVNQVYFMADEFKHIQSELNNLVEENFEEMVVKVGEENRDLLVKKEKIREALFEVFGEVELNSANVEMLQNMGKGYIEELSKKTNIAAVIAKLYQLSEILADHSINVGNLSMFFAMLVGNGDKGFLEEIYLGSLLHDYGKLKIPSNILDNPNSPTFSKAIQDHPTKGASMVKKIKGVGPNVICIIEQHHEQFNGRGYPKSLIAGDIHPMARIVSVANIYDNVLTENKIKKEAEAHKIAIKFVEYDRGKHFDPQLMPRIIDGLKLAFGNFYR